jgi:hypothetical protein
MRLIPWTLRSGSEQLLTLDRLQMDLFVVNQSFIYG